MGNKLIQKLETTIPGCYELQPIIHKDARGCFVKFFHQTTFLEIGLPTDYKEEYYSISTKGVVRGLHFQIPPYDQDKIVFCPEGKVMDVAVDIRAGSPTYGKYYSFILDSNKGNMAFLPKGLAHGFCVLSESALMLYKVTSEYAPMYDMGILWNSAGIPWPVKKPILSRRDQDFVTLSQFESPFYYEK
ncbi:dTDP-4-dehydrorhamnose 3,5-epimerase [Mitsuokella multacida]|uniref:dTDP-4-dehydrorhamnose 3,5-epimerase n=1 Tax=Mitsuokella multacida TaxID=52226 RepID=UPI001F1A44E2|nr:dTDP-4-dehydrorhamnose 3,5-epimerase [Mitsuokella multacida]MCF2584141.1 dTDP-4-dehydrorhamnose 3,5-epimerase [Mitsuokella multacida]